jgi:hypothetical protein
MNIETPEFFLWSQVIFLWAVVAYGINSDPLPEDATSKTFSWAKWKAVTIVRTIFLFGATFLISESVSLSLWVLLIAIIQPWFRYKLPNRWTAEIETGIVFINLVGTLIFIRHAQLVVQRGIHVSLTPEKVSAICITATTMLFVVRGGTYIVRGCLSKSEALPHKKFSPRRRKL